MKTTLTHLGNDGIMLNDGTNTVMIDGLFRGVLERWSHLPEDQQTKLEQAEAPFDNVNTILITHKHLDHYHPESVGSYLQHNPKAEVIAPSQVVNEMQEKYADFDQIKDRFHDYGLKFYETAHKTVNGVQVDVLAMHHFNMFEYNFEGVQNYGYVVHMNGKSFLHLGDVDMSRDNLEKFEFDQMDIDVVFLPMFSKNLLPQRRDLIEELVQPKHVVALHVMVGTEEETPDQVHELYPDATVFTQVLETVEI